MNPETPSQSATERVLTVKKSYERELMAKPYVVGVGVGFKKIAGKSTDTLAVVVMVSKKILEKDLEPGDQIPHELEGVPVDVQEVGEIVAY